MVHLDQVREPRVEHRAHAVAHDALGVVVVLRRPVLPFLPREEVARARERRHPSAVLEPRVPPDVVDMEMRADDEVDRFGREARRRQIVEERRAHHVKGRAASAILVVAHARVDEGREPRRLDHECVNALEEPALLVEEVRREPFAMALERGGHGVRQEPGRARGAGALDDGGDAETADGQGMHGDKLGDRLHAVNVTRGTILCRSF